LVNKDLYILVSQFIKKCSRIIIISIIICRRPDVCQKPSILLLSFYGTFSLGAQPPYQMYTRGLAERDLFTQTSAHPPY